MIQYPRFDVVVTTVDYTDTEILVRWLLPVGYDDLGNALAYQFDRILGVESVTLQKYSALLRVAPHVTNLKTVAAAVGTCLHSDLTRQHLQGWFGSADAFEVNLTVV
jgi:hypothetical protein